MFMGSIGGLALSHSLQLRGQLMKSSEIPPECLEIATVCQGCDECGKCMLIPQGASHQGGPDHLWVIRIAVASYMAECHSANSASWCESRKNGGVLKWSYPNSWMVYTCLYWKIPISKLWMIRRYPHNRKPPKFLNGLCVNHPRKTTGPGPPGPSQVAVPHPVLPCAHATWDVTFFAPGFPWGAYFGVQFPVRNGCLCGCVCVYIYLSP